MYLKGQKSKNTCDNVINKITAVVITHNRLHLLKECLRALENQSYPLYRILVVDNNSTDGTKDFLKNLGSSKFIIFRLNKNTGASGGFYHGIKEGYSTGADFLWIMDDDAVPKEDALLRLIEGYDLLKEKNERIKFLSSNVFWINGELAKMNVPKTEKTWNKYLKYGIVEIKSTSFVSFFISRDVVKEIGLPIKEFFIWLTDVEYSSRETKDYSKGFIIGESEVIHKVSKNIEAEYGNINKDNILKFKYFSRNQVYLIRTRKKLLINKIKLLASLFFQLIKVLFSGNFKYFPILFWYFLKGFCFNPEIEYVD